MNIDLLHANGMEGISLILFKTSVLNFRAAPGLSWRYIRPARLAYHGMI